MKQEMHIYKEKKGTIYLKKFVIIADGTCDLNEDMQKYLETLTERSCR